MSTIHIVGAGLAGLACAVKLAGRGRQVRLWEAAGHAGGRCRSFEDNVTGRRIDNGNHLLLSANHNALSYLEAIGASNSLKVGEPIFPFVDVRSGETWCVRPGAGRWPGWLFDKTRNIPGITARSYLRLLCLGWPGLSRKRVADCVAPDSMLAERFLDPFTVAVLNASMKEADARLTFKALMLSFGKGATECRPMMARDGLSETFIDPALNFLEKANISVTYSSRLRSVEFEGDKLQALDFVQRHEAITDNDYVVLALPALSVASLIPGLDVPRQTESIVNVHIRLETPVKLPQGAPIMGIVGGTAQWFMARGDILSATISAAHDIAEWSNEQIAEKVWSDAKHAFALRQDAMPSIRVVKERRATFLQTPEEVVRRPGARTRWPNIILAGDWTDTGLPATIDGAIYSGQRAAHVLLKN